MDKKLRCILIDDELNNVVLLEKIIFRKCHQLIVVDTETNPLAGLKLIEELQPDLVFLDIKMPGLNGFELLKKLEPVKFEVIFVTAFSEFAMEAIEHQAIGYLTKPILDDKLLKAVHNAEERILQKNTTANIFSFLETKMNHPQQIKIPLSTLNGMIFENEEDIIYCESNGSYTNFYTAQGKKLIASKPLGEYEKTLPEGYFVRIHDKYIINLRYVNEYIRGRGGEIKLNNVVMLPVSANRKEQLIARFERWMNRK